MKWKSIFQYNTTQLSKEEIVNDVTIICDFLSFLNCDGTTQKMILRPGLPASGQTLKRSCTFSLSPEEPRSKASSPVSALKSMLITTNIGVVPH